MLQLLQLPRAQVFSTADTAASCSGVEHAQLLSSDSRLWDLAVTQHHRAAVQRICKALGATAQENRGWSHIRHKHPPSKSRLELTSRQSPAVSPASPPKASSILATATTSKIQAGLVHLVQHKGLALKADAHSLRAAQRHQLGIRGDDVAAVRCADAIRFIHLNGPPA